MWRLGDRVMSGSQATPANRILDWREAAIALGIGITEAWVILLGY
jgi:hypothetical protein